MTFKATTQIALQKNKPRVHFEYEVYTNGALEMMEIPFDIGVMADLSGDRKVGETNDAGKVLKYEMRDRDFVEIANESPAEFDKLFSSINPKLKLELEYGDGVQEIELEFNSMADFGPDEILKKLAEKVPAVKQLKDLRAALLQCQEKVNVSREFEKTLKEVLNDPSKLNELKGLMGIGSGGGGGGDAPSEGNGEAVSEGDGGSEGGDGGSE